MPAEPDGLDRSYLQKQVACVKANMIVPSEAPPVISACDGSASAGTAACVGVADPSQAYDATDVDALDTLFKGFADPTRLRILNVLVPGELCVCDIVELLELPQPAVSRHLAYLRRSGLVEVTREWKFAHYRLAAPLTTVHAALIACVHSCFTGIVSLGAERARAEARVRDRSASPC
ncbi:MAG: metalloregulator ArsR/SmtB family transcription factor [Gemmatimonadaceae bacterium]|nr:metalloregulator ArsR/SmtB family transcription factor [Gemmatimonadaceae bacterium]